MSLNLGKYYFRTTCIPTAISFLAVVLFLFYDHHWGPGANYKSEWLTADSLDGWVCLLILGNGVIIAILSTPLFFNRNVEVRNNPFVSFLAWCALPIFYMFYMTYYSANDDYEMI